MLHNMIWNLLIWSFDLLPKKIQLNWAKRHCSVAAQYIAKYTNDSIGFVYLVEVENPIQNNGLISGHFMNIDKTGNFFDFYGNKIPGVEIGEETMFRAHTGHRYVCVAKSDKWFKLNLISMLQKTKELNEYLYRTRR